MPSDAAKRRKEERAAKRAAKGSTASKPEPGCDDDGHSGEATTSGPAAVVVDASVSAAADEVSVRFPTSLTSRQRAVLHAVAERLSLIHI